MKLKYSWEKETERKKNYSHPFSLFQYYNYCTAFRNFHFNYLMDNLLLSYNLTSIINFQMRIQNTYTTAINNIFIDISQFESYTTSPILNGLSDHDDQLVRISTDYSHKPI